MLPPVRRFFNLTGPCNPADHYMLPAEGRIRDLLPFIERKLYFVVHAARQTGKSTAMLALAARMRELGYAALHATLETSQWATDADTAEPLWLSAIHLAAQDALDAQDRPPDFRAFLNEPAGERLRHWLRAWSVAVAPKAVVLLLDEADTVRGEALVSLLRQLRAGFSGRGVGTFPTSVALVGMRDLRDYLTRSKDGVPIHPGSPFNIKGASVTMRNFTADEVTDLYGQYTADTGQAFTPQAIAQAFWWTQGQPFLVNALASICVTELVPGREQPIEAADIDRAKERLIRERTTHLDSLAERLKEPRVAPIVQAVIAGDIPRSIPYDHDDFQYVVDLGLIRMGPEGAEPACPLYREVLARQVTHNLQLSLTRPQWRWQTNDDRLDFPALVDAFLDWWRINADALVDDIPLYPEAVPHIAFMAFLQRVINGGGQVQREYAAGRGAVDLLVTYGDDRFAVELKRVRPKDGLDTIREAGVQQLAGYLDHLGLAEGWLLVFDQRPGRTWTDRLWRDERIVRLWRDKRIVPPRRIQLRGA